MTYNDFYYERIDLEESKKCDEPRADVIKVERRLSSHVLRAFGDLYRRVNAFLHPP